METLTSCVDAGKESPQGCTHFGFPSDARSGLAEVANRLATRLPLPSERQEFIPKTGG